MAAKDKLKEELKVWIYYEAIKVASENNEAISYEDVNSVLIEILHENNRHDPKELFKTA